MEKIWLKSYDPGVAHSMNYPNHTLQQLLDESVERYPDNTAITFPGAFNDESMMSYKELDLASNKLANALVDMGVKKGDRVALLMPNCPQFVISYYAVLRAGGIVVATNPLYSAREMEFQFNDRDCSQPLLQDGHGHKGSNQSEERSGDKY